MIILLALAFLAISIMGLFIGVVVWWWFNGRSSE